jgi:hypothetical protein
MLECFIARQRFGKHFLTELNALINRRAMFSVVITAGVDVQRCGKDISAAVNQHATTE